MFQRNYATSLALVLAASFVPSLVLAQEAEQTSVYDSDQAVTLVEGTSIKDAIAGLESKLLDRGFRRRIEGAFAGETIRTEGGSPGAASKVVMIPYTNTQGNSTTWVLAVVQTNENGETTAQLLLTPTTPTCETCIPNPGQAEEPRLAKIRAASAWDDFQEIIRAIRNGNISYGIGYTIGSFIRRGLPDWIMAPQIKSAYQSRGYVCVDPPWWMLLPKSIWYASTCARPVY